MSGWAETKLGKICSFQAGDAFGKEEQGRSYGDHPFIKVSDLNLSGNELFIAYANNWVSDEEAKTVYRLHPSDAVVFAKIGIALTYNRRRRLIRPTVIDNNMMSAICVSDVNATWFYYLLKTLDFNLISSGSALPYLTVKDLSQIGVLLPSHEEQKAIAAILGALDDKIELNRRMNATLEAMARALFKSWFVDFDPVRAKMAGAQPFGMDSETAALFPSRLVPSELGDIPEGWEVCTIEDLGRLVTGKTPSTAVSENFGNDIPFITIPDLDGRMFITSCGRRLSEQGASSVKNCILPVGAVMMSCIATVGLCGVTTRPSVTNQQINSLICNEEIANPNYVYWLFKGITAEVHDNGGGGSVYTNVSKSRFGSIKILQPPIALQHAFDQGWFEKLKKNQEEIDALSKLRDYLLPKLISGDIRIPDAEKYVEMT